MKITALALSIVVAATAQTAFAAQGQIPKGVPHLDHVFVIMMENQAYAQIADNPNAPFINSLMITANLGTNYFGVGHPSLTNYLEVVGGSNFGVRSDHSPDWGNTACTPFAANLEATSPSGVCPIYGTGTDQATPAIDTTNETSGPPGLLDIDGTKDVPAAANTSGMTIADQLTQKHMSWESYQEDMSPNGLYNVNYSDGVFDNTTNFAVINSTITGGYQPPLSSSDIVQLYAVKHNPFVYFKNVQDSIHNPENGFANFGGFNGANGLFADLASGNVPNYSFIAPNQCNDMHGRGNAGPYCAYDPGGGTQDDTNPALIQRGDVAVKKLVTAIKASPAWHQGHNAIVILWDENDYSVAPITNRVPLIVVTNYGPQGVQSSTYYNHFSLLKTIEGGLGLPCLNHACDSDVKVMADLFAK